jgi:serine/threonine protein kinase
MEVARDSLAIPILFTPRYNFQWAVTLTPGTRLGPYEILAPLGAGGMGEVYHARDGRLDRTVALKLLRAGVAADQNYRKRFLREVRASAAVSHPGIAAVYDSGEAGDHLYLAMEYIPGPTLQQELENGPVPSGLWRDYALQIANALEHAHARGIIHRDIKPGNIIVTGNGTLKLLDFGLAQYILSPEETATAVTAAGAMVGTWHYCAPEILTGRLATVRSDIYGLGVVMYEMGCGRVPFAGLQGAALLSAVLRGQAPPVRQRNPAISEVMAKLIGRAMAAEPGDRFSSAAELAAALRTMEIAPTPRPSCWNARGRSSRCSISKTSLAIPPQTGSEPGLLKPSLRTWESSRRSKLSAESGYNSRCKASGTKTIPRQSAGAWEPAG